MNFPGFFSAILLSFFRAAVLAPMFRLNGREATGMCTYICACERNTAIRGVLIN